MTFTSIFNIFSQDGIIPKNEIEAVYTCVASSLEYSSLRQHQKNVITNFVAGNDVFAILPTGYTARVCAMLVYLAHLISFWTLRILLWSLFDSLVINRWACTSIPFLTNSLLKISHHNGLTCSDASLYNDHFTVESVISHPQPKQYIVILLSCVWSYWRSGNCFLITHIPFIQIMYARVTRPLEQRASWARAIYSKGRLRQTSEHILM